MCNFLEIHNNQYKEKYNDLLAYVIENMSNEERNKLYKNEKGEPMLLLKPILKRQCRIYNSEQVYNDSLYKLLTNIMSQLEIIIQIENDYLNHNN